MQDQRHLFTLRENQHYLNSAYKSPLLKASEKAVMKAVIKSRNPADYKARDFFIETEKVRNLFSQLIHCDPQDIAIIPSTSFGFASVLYNLEGKRNGHAITIHNEFPSGHFSLKRWCNKNANDLKVIIPDEGLETQGANWNQKILDAINTKTSVVLMSSVHWMTGIKFDLKKIGDRCKEMNAVLIIDGTQTIGATPMDLCDIHVDALICASYKWLFGPYSMGLAYIGKRFHNGIPIEESWMNRGNAQDFSNLTDYDFNYGEGAMRYSVGEKSNLYSMPVLIEGLRQLLDWGIQNMEAYNLSLVQPLLQYLEKLGVKMEEAPYFSPHLMGLRLPASIDSELLNKNIAEAGIILSVRGSVLRVSVNVFNTQDDIQKLIDVIEASKVS